MISVLSHRRPLSGSSFFLLICLLVCLSCDSLKQIPEEENRAAVTEEISRDEPKVDTVNFMIVDQPDPGPIISTDTLNVSIAGRNYKDRYKGLIVLPFNAADTQQIANMPTPRKLILHYYAGLKLALKDLERDGLFFDLTVIDSESEIGLEQLFLYNPDFIIGGKGPEEVKILAEYAADIGSAFFSPWYPRADFLDAHPSYIQLNPSIEVHMLALLEDVISNFDLDQIHLVGTPTEAARMNQINDLYQSYYGRDSLIDTILLPSYKHLDNMDFTWIQDRSKKQVFIIPATRNYFLIHDFFRTLNMAEIRDEVVIYGITSWNNDVLWPFLNAFDVRLTSADWPDGKMADSVFVENYYKQNGVLPVSKSFEGYNHLKYIGLLFETYGADLDDIENALQYDANNGIFQIMTRSMALRRNMDNPQLNAQFFENGVVYLLQFEDYRYKRIE